MISLVLGGAPSVWADVEAAKAALDGRAHLVVACNDAGARYEERLDAWASLHPEHLERWAAERAGNADYRRFRPNEWPGPEATVAPERWPGSSGLYALQIALFEMGATAAILCGVPMEQGAGHFTHDGPWAATSSYRYAFQAALPVIGGRTRSMGGWTARLFGQPTPEWIAAVGNIKPAAQPRPYRRVEDMHRVENTSEAHQSFFVRNDDGSDQLVHLEPGQSGEFEIDPEQARFQEGGPLKASALKASKTTAPEAASKPAEAKPPAPAGHKPL